MTDFMPIDDVSGLPLSMVRGDGLPAKLVEIVGENVTILSQGSSPPGSRPQFDVSTSSEAAEHPTLSQRRLRVKVHHCAREAGADGAPPVFLIKGRLLDLTRPVREALAASVS